MITLPYIEFKIAELIKESKWADKIKQINIDTISRQSHKIQWELLTGSMPRVQCEMTKKTEWKTKFNRNKEFSRSNNE